MIQQPRLQLIVQMSKLIKNRISTSKGNLKLQNKCFIDIFRQGFAPFPFFSSSAAGELQVPAPTPASLSTSAVVEVALAETPAPTPLLEVTIF
uniref:Uncharacterized protein n=1 Tax=Arundo donax TaxID=35708 RepID=A0A0A9GLF7_ARUDO